MHCPSPSSRYLVVAFAGLLLLAGGCRDRPRVTGPGNLRDIPLPDLDRLEPQVAEQLRRQQVTLESIHLQAGGEGEELGSVYGSMGRLYHAYQLLDAAEACYHNARTLEPGQAQWSYYLGRVYGASGKTAEAVDSLEHFVAQRPDDAPGWLALGQLRREGGDLAGAVEALERALAAQPDSAAATFELGQIALEEGQYEAAAGRFEQVLKAQPSATRVHLPLSTAYRQLGRVEDAERHLTLRGEGPITARDPWMEELTHLATGARAHLDAGLMAFRRRDYRAAASAFRRAVESDPDNAAARQNLASALTLSGRPEDAELEYREALRIDPRFAQAHFNLGTLLASLGRRPEAVNALREAVKIDPRYRDAHFNLANTLLQDRLWSEAQKHFETVLELDPSNGMAYLGVSRCLAAQQLWRQALDKVEAGRRALPQDARLTLSAVRLLAAAPEASVRDGNRARQLAEGLVSRQRNAYHLEALAMAEAEVGAFEQAIRWQRAALELGHSDPDHMGRNLELYESGRPSREPWPGIGEIASQG